MITGLMMAALAVPMVTGGHPVDGSYPFLVRAGGCTGSLVDASWVVTAKHCDTPATVRVGSTNRTSGGTVVAVTRTVSHARADLKLLRLAKPVSHEPMAIAVDSGEAGTKTRIVGWGVTCRRKNCADPPVKAHELDTSVRPDRDCRGIDGAIEICTDNPHGDSGACYGDSGGPQLRRDNGGWILIGATSRTGNGSSTCATGPSIYTDLTALRPWIIDQLS